MADKAQTIIDGATVGARVAEALVPGVAPFTPVIDLILTAFRAHFNATHGQFPTEAEIFAAVPERVRAIEAIWSQWTPSGDGTLPAARAGLT